MTGCIATFMAWTFQHLEKEGKAPDTELLQGVSPTMLACYSGCLTGLPAEAASHAGWGRHPTCWGCLRGALGQVWLMQLLHELQLGAEAACCVATVP